MAESRKSGCTTCCRVMLILINLVLAAAGLAVVGEALWYRYDDRTEGALKSAIADTNPNPYEMWDLKYQFRTMGTVAFWVMAGIGVALALIALIGICGSCATSRSCSALYTTLILLLILVQLAAASLLVIYRGDTHRQIMNMIYRYLGVAYQYNLPDALVVQNRFRCCGDGTFNRYNYVCPGIPLPNCVDVINSDVNFVTLIGGCLLGVLIGIEVLSVIFSFVMIYRRDTPSPT